MAVKKELYNVAIAGQGYILAGTPDNPARRLEQAPVYGNRFASGDRDYTDFSLWWYWAQTDWSGGIKKEKKWRDDACYWYSRNIDAFSEFGAIKLAPAEQEVHTFSYEITDGTYGSVGGGANKHYISYYDSSASKPVIVESSNGSTWTDISSSTTNTGSGNYTTLKIIQGDLWTGRTNSGSNVVMSYDGSSWTDHTSNIGTATGDAVQACYAISEAGAYIYAGIYGGDANKNVNLVRYDSSSWEEVAQWSDGKKICAIQEFGGLVYLLRADSYTTSLEAFDPSSSSSTTVFVFNSGIVGSSFTNRYLYVLNNKLIISLPSATANAIWLFDGSTLSRFDYHSVAPYVNTTSAVFDGTKIYWGNLVYDGNFFFNYKQLPDADPNYSPVPLYIADEKIYWVPQLQSLWGYKLYRDNGYKSTLNYNYIVLNEISLIPTIEKIAHSVSLTFDTLATGQEIKVSYFIDGGSEQTLGTISYSSDGAITGKTLTFPDNTTFHKIQFKIYLKGNGNNTPIIRDMSLAYLPLPDYKQRWTLQVYCYDDIMLLDGKTREAKRGEELRNILKTAWWSKEVVNFHDIDYAETTLNGNLNATSTTINVVSTAGFPEQGRIRIDDEEILYTGKTATAFTGCTRGARGTEKSSHSDGATVSNGYKVLITNYIEQAPVGANAKIDEYIVALELREV